MYVTTKFKVQKLMKLLIPWNRDRDKLIIAQLVKKFLGFTELECLLPCPQ